MRVRVRVCVTISLTIVVYMNGGIVRRVGDPDFQLVVGGCQLSGILL